MHRSCGYQEREDCRTGHLDVLRTEQNVTPLDPIGNNASNQGKKEDGDSAEKLVESEVEGRVTELVNQPALRHNLHPRADAGGAGTDPHETEIAILKCFKDPADDDCRSHADSRNVTCGSAFAKPGRPAIKKS
jgi:hypothetical protein